MSGKIEKIIARLQSKIAEGAYYEAQQQTRVVAARYIKSSSYNDAINILYSVAQSMLKAGQGGSGGDLGLMMLDVYKQAELKPDSTTKGRVVGLLRGFGEGEPSRKRFIGESVGWTAKFGEYPAGDPELHHVAGSIYADEQLDAYEAERHLALGTAASPEVLARMEYAWYRGGGEAHAAALYAARAVLPYLLLGNLGGAAAALRVFAARLGADNPGLAAQDVASSTADIRVFPSLPLLNFLGLLLLAVRKGSPDLFRGLKSHYAVYLKDVTEWNEALELLAEMYFGIQRPRQANPLFDMMGSMFGMGNPFGGAGGGDGGRSAGRKPAAKKFVEPPPAEGLD